MITPTGEQEEALNAISNWYLNSSKVREFKLGGLAGTGKSALIPLISETLKLAPSEVFYVAPTNKAAEVMTEKLRAAKIAKNAVTLHSKLQHGKMLHCSECPIAKNQGALYIKCHVQDAISDCGCNLDFTSKNLTELPSLIICDEASMVNEEIYEELDKIKDVKILFVGDHGQLPAVGTSFEILENIDFSLKEIHRTTKDSPILNLAYEARETGIIKRGQYGEGVFKAKFEDADFSIFDPKHTTLITYFRKNMDHYLPEINRSCLVLNNMWRGGQNLQGPPKVGERVIARRVNANRMNRVAKGTIGIIVDIKYVDDVRYLATVEVNGRSTIYSGYVSSEQFDMEQDIRGLEGLDLWGYGYCLTAHEAQGSEFDSVIVFEPSDLFRSSEKNNSSIDYRRWLYTAITRAKSKLAIIG